MATKIYCDGCGVEITPHSKNKHIICSTIVNGAMSTRGEWDLCEDCLMRFEHMIDVNSWPRDKRQTERS